MFDTNKKSIIMTCITQPANPYLAIIGPICLVYRIDIVKRHLPDIVLPIGIQSDRHLVGYTPVQYEAVITLVVYPSLVRHYPDNIMHLT